MTARAGQTVMEEMWNEVRDVAIRLKEKAEILDAMARDKDPNDEIARAWLNGKAEGVRLALSFVGELLR